MPAKTKAYEQFGSFILFKRLEADVLSELWRAGRIEGSSIGSVVALRRFVGGDRATFASVAPSAKTIVAAIQGTSFVRGQDVGETGGIGWMAHEYGGGRSLRHIVDRGRGATGATPNPLPVDQAVAVAQKVAHSLATLNDIRMGADRLLHGALLPQLVWIADDGEVRVAGQGLAPAVLSSLRDPAVASEIGRYFAPELRQGGAPTRSSEVFAIGALFFLLATGNEPPDALEASAFAQAVRASKTPLGEPVPADIRAVLERSLAFDPKGRYESASEMRQALTSLANSGQYAATTFNLAFYVSSLLKKEMEGEAIDRDRELKVNVAAYLEAPAAAASSSPAAVAAAPGQPASSRSRMPLAAAAAAAVVLLGGGAAYMLISKKPAAAGTPVAAAQMVAPKPKPALVSPALVASPSAKETVAAPATTTAPALDPEAARRKAFEEAVEKKLQEELMKLQREYTSKLAQQQSKQAPVQVASAVPVAASARTEEEEHSPTQLDQQRLGSIQKAEAPAPSRPEPQSAPAPAAPLVPAAPAPAPAASVREGDIVDVGTLDSLPQRISGVAPQYPPMALRQKAEATILVTALISENGEVIQANILRGDKRYGFDDAALRAVRGTRFTSPMKDGKRVKCWFPIPVAFKL